MASASDRRRIEFEETALPHARSLYGVAVRLTRNSQEAEDLVQETLLRAYRFFDRWEPGTNIRAWLFRVMKNLFINRYRHDQREPMETDFEGIEENLDTLMRREGASGTKGSDPESLVMAGVLDADVARALKELPDEYRLVLLLSAIEEMPYKEIASVLSCPIGTVMSRLHRARRLMQSKLAEVAKRRRWNTAGESTSNVIPMPLPRRAGKE